MCFTQPFLFHQFERVQLCLILPLVYKHSLAIYSIPIARNKCHLVLSYYLHRFVSLLLFHFPVSFPSFFSHQHLVEFCLLQAQNTSNVAVCLYHKVRNKEHNQENRCLHKPRDFCVSSLLFPQALLVFGS